MTLNIDIPEKLYKTLEHLRQTKFVNMSISDLIEWSLIDKFNITLFDIEKYSKMDIELPVINEYNLLTNYVYIYLNSLEQGSYKYDKYEFNYKPIYVGKGKNNRYIHHINGSHNEKLNKKIKEIKNNNGQIIINIIEKNLSNIDAYHLERYMINIISKDINICNEFKSNNIKPVDFTEFNIFNQDIRMCKDLINSLNNSNTLDEAANKLGISIRTLHRKLSDMNINWKEIKKLKKV